MRRTGHEVKHQKRFREGAALCQGHAGVSRACPRLSQHHNLAARTLCDAMPLNCAMPQVLKFQEAQNRVSASNDFFRGLSKEADLVMDGDLLMVR